MSYYGSKQYEEEVYNNVGLNDLAIELNSRFVADIYAECEKEYQKSGNILAFKPTENIHNHLIAMIQKSLILYHRNRTPSFNS